MIYGVGVDIVKIARVTEMLKRFEDKLAKRILSPRELERYSHFHSNKEKAAYLARRFAAKEAISKALGIGISKISLSDIEVINDSLGKPIVSLLKLPPILISLLPEGYKIDLSITDEQDSAIAFAIISCEKN